MDPKKKNRKPFLDDTPDGDGDDHEDDIPVHERRVKMGRRKEILG